MSDNSRNKVAIRVVVFEQQFWLTPELQRQFQDETCFEVQYVSNLNSIHEIFDKRHSAELEILILDFKDSSAECLAYLADGEKNRFRSRRMIVALVDQQIESLEWRLREAGCTSVHFHPFGGEMIAETIQLAAKPFLQNLSKK